MNRHHTFPYPSFPAAGPAPGRYNATHSTSSAQSPSANPDEDWTKISDLAERRRIQNRIAQRNYRKKLKRRLEDLERRAGSSSDSPEQQHPEVMPGQRSKTDDAGKKKKPAKPGPSAPKQNRSPIPPLTASFPTRDDNGGMFSRQYTRQLSTSPPPAFTYSQYPGTEPPPIHAPYPQHAPFHTLPAPYPDFHSQPLFLPPLPGTRPSLNSYDSAPVKQEGHFEDDGMISHFNMSYSSPMGAVEAPTTQSYTDPNAYTPPLSISNSFDHSRATSPSEQSMMCPQTPKGIILSPRALVHS